ncbi:uncharacterized protein LOC109803315 [Cajanus cajan]|uniref:uncharacterized protein LOC109803315 n=1 Tax=Cajanus cajan TaxID=3821 RepID=UPI00098D9180|nr:uncharacterized protein LOC109803315 [Cajanus cajan]
MTETSKPIVALLKKANRFQWTDECEVSFQLFKQRLGTPLVLAKLIPGREVILYLAVSGEAISVVMVQEEDGKQRPIYFIIRVLQDTEHRYQLLEKVALGLIYAAQRLRQYLQSHTVVVQTDCPIAKVLRKPELAGRMMAWSIELSEFDIRFEPRGTIKSQCLANFLNELSPPGQFEDGTWTMRVDGSSNCQGSGVGIILESPSGITLEQSLHFGFKASNNQAEYEALLARMRLAAEMGVRKIICWTDSKVVTKQVINNFQVKDPNLLKYYHLFWGMSNQFTKIQVKHTLHGNNERADQLVWLASSRKPGQLRSTIHLELSTPSVTQACIPIDEVPKSWMTELMNFIVSGTELLKPSEAKKLRTQAARYSVISGELYRRGFSTPLLKCIDPQQAEYIMREIHEGICGSHSGGRMLATKVLRAGYYWPTLKIDCPKYVKKCIQCQQHGHLIHA